MRWLSLITLLIISSCCLSVPQNVQRPPQFGGNFAGSFQSRPPPASPTEFLNEDCSCLPGNQPCPPGFGAISTRIHNTRPFDVCPVADILCCKDGVPPPFGSPRQPTEQRGCGSRDQIVLRKGSLANAEADFGEYPWMVAIVSERRGGVPDYVGGGVLISDRVVLTAAHILEDHRNSRNLVARVGDYDLSSVPGREIRPHQAIPVSKITIHEKANFHNLQNDLAILELATPVRNDINVRPACLPFFGQRFESRTCFLSGWGKNALGRPQAILREVDLPIVEHIRCEQRLINDSPVGQNFRLDPSFLCAGGEVGKDACQGDGGSPVVCLEKNRWVVVGLVAGGIGCGTNVPGLYVNIAYFADYINNYLQPTFGK